MTLIDTNILLYAINKDDPRSDSACMMLESLANEERSWALSWSIVYEFLRVATHPRVFPSPMKIEEAWSFIVALLRQSSGLMLVETSDHAEVTARCLREAPRIQGNLMHDFHLAVLMREHGVTQVLTEDRDFLMFPWIEIRRLPMP